MSIDNKDLQKIREKIEEKLGLMTLSTGPEIALIKERIPDAKLSSVRLTNPEEGEGLRVVLVEDSRGKTHRVCLRPH